MKIKIQANFIHEGKRIQIAEEIEEFVTDPPQKKDTTRLSNMVKEWFENQLNRIVVVKTRIKNDEVLVSVSIRPGVDDINKEGDHL
jgi:hypothetical protein